MLLESERPAVIAGLIIFEFSNFMGLRLIQPLSCHYTFDKSPVELREIW